MTAHPQQPDLNDLHTLSKYGYVISSRSVFNDKYPQASRAGIHHVPGVWAVYDAHGDKDSWAIVGEDLGVLIQETLQHLKPVPLVFDEKAIFQSGIEAHSQGVKWWQNPHNSGSKAAYVWANGHTHARQSGAKS